MKMFTLLIVIAMVMAQDNFLEKSKHQLRKQKDLAAEIYQIPKKGAPVFLGKSTDKNVREQLESLVAVEESLKKDPKPEFNEIKYIQSTYIIDEQSPNAVRPDPKQFKIMTAFTHTKKEHSDISNEKVDHYNNNCVYLFSECGFKGKHQKTCKDAETYVNNIVFGVKSIKLAPGQKMSLKTGNDIKMFDESQKCMKESINFLDLDVVTEIQFADGSKQLQD